MNTQVNTFHEAVRIKADLAKISSFQISSSDTAQGVLTKSKRARVWRETSLSNKWPSCVIVGADTPKRLHLVNETSNEVIKKVDLPGKVLHVAIHENFFGNGQILAFYEDPGNPLKFHACILKYDAEKKSLRRYPDILFDTFCANPSYVDQKTGETVKGSRLDSQDIFAMSTLMMGDLSITPDEFFTSDCKNMTRALSHFSFRSWIGADECSVTAQHVVARNMSAARIVQFFKHSYNGYRNKFIQLSELNLVSRYRRGTCMLSASDSARLNSKFIHTSRRTLLEIDSNQHWVCMLLRSCDSQNTMGKEAYGFFPYRNPSIRYSEYALEKAMMLFKLPDDTLSLSCSRNKVYAAVNNEVRVYDDFQRIYTEAVSTNKGVINEEDREATVKSLLPTDPADVSYYSRSWEDVLKHNYTGSLDNVNELNLGDPATVYTFADENVASVSVQGSDPFEMMCVHTLRFGELSQNRQHKSDALYVYLGGRLIFKKSFSNGITDFRSSVVSITEENNRDNCFPGTSVREVCVTVCLDEKVFMSFDIFPERSTVTVRDIQREQVQTRTVSAPQLSRFIDF